MSGNGRNGFSKGELNVQVWKVCVVVLQKFLACQREEEGCGEHPSSIDFRDPGDSILIFSEVNTSKAIEARVNC